MMYLPLASLHGVSEGFDEGAGSFARPLHATLQRIAQAHKAPAYPPPHPVVWASLAAGIALEGMDAMVFGKAMAATQGTWRNYVRDVLVYTGPSGWLIKGRVRLLLRELTEKLGEAPVLYAHSLGSVIAMDLLLDALEQGQPPPFSRAVSAGSPLGVSIPFAPLRGFRDRAARWEKLRAAGAQVPADFCWVNCYDKDDPIATGAATGVSFALDAGRLKSQGYEGIVAGDVPVNAGVHLRGHVSYHSDAVVAQTVTALLDR
jgi:hypothetical protein